MNGAAYTPGGTPAGARRDRLESAPALSAKTYTLLPDLLRRGAGHFEQEHERDVWLSAALPVLSACLPKCGAWHVDGWYTPHVNACIVAPASSGKGVMKWARKLGDGVNQMIVRSSEVAREEWKEESLHKRKGETGPEPPRRSLFVGGNASSAAFIRALEVNTTSCIFESEIDTLVASQAQDWGNFSDVLRKAFHHEEVLVERVGERVAIKPYLAMCLAGTPEQFLRLIGTAENGLFSRFGFYVFSSQDPYRSQRPTQLSHDRYWYFNEAAETVRKLYNALAQREKALGVVLTDEHWDAHDACFAAALERVEEQERPEETKATVKRMGVVALRIATVLAVLRAFETDGTGVYLHAQKAITTTDEDVEAALLIAQTWLTHAAMLLTHLPTNERPIIQPKRKKEAQLLALLPAEFSRAEAQEIGTSKLSASTRTIDRYLDRLTQAGALVRPGGEYGQYVKADLIEG